MSVATVRVANPAAPGEYMIINADAVGPEHQLWAEQAEGYQSVPMLATDNRMDPAERDLAAEILSRLVLARYGLSAEAWQALPGAERLDRLRVFEADASGHSVNYGAAPDLTVSVARANGPRGLWYVMADDKRVSAGFRTEVEAEAERARMGF